MRVTIHQKDLEITPPLASYIEAKVSKPITTLLKGMTKQEFPILDLEFSRNTRHHHKGRVYHAEANLSLGKTFFRASVEDEDIRAACDLLEAALSREIRSFQNRARTLARKGSRRAKADVQFDPAARLNTKKSQILKKR